MTDSKSIGLFSSPAIKTATCFDAEEMKRFKIEAERYDFRDPVRGGIIVCYRHPDNTILIDELILPDKEMTI